MKSFFLFDGLNKLGWDAAVEEDMLPWEKDYENGDVIDPGSHDWNKHWERLLQEHTLVRQARSFARSCDTLSKRLNHPTPPDQEAATLTRYAHRVPKILAEALVAEVNGAEHRECEPACVAYDIHCLTNTRANIARALTVLERLLVKYPQRNHDIVRLLDQAADMETNVSARIVHMCNLWHQKRQRPETVNN